VLPYQPSTGPPPFVAPHQPRLDWQMWFAALRGRPPPWFPRLVSRLFEASPPVLGLFEHAPFGGDGPVWIRAVVEDCRLADFERMSEGQWWDCREPRIYFPATHRSESVPTQP